MHLSSKPINLSGRSKSKMCKINLMHTIRRYTLPCQSANRAQAVKDKCSYLIQTQSDHIKSRLSAINAINYISPTDHCMFKLVLSIIQYTLSGKITMAPLPLPRSHSSPTFIPLSYFPDKKLLLDFDFKVSAHLGSSF